MKEIIDDFLVEADELINSLDNNFVKLESSPGDLDLLNEIFRAAHTIKGTSSFLGFEQVTTLSHRMEDILNKLRKSEMVVTPEVMDLLLESLDLLKVLLDNVRSGSGEQVNLDAILARLSAVLTSQDSQSSSGGAAGDKDAPEPESAAVEAMQEPAPEAAQPTDTAPQTAEISPDAPAAPKSVGTAKKPTTEQTIRVDVERLDTLMNMMGELVLSRNSLMQTVNKLNAEHE